MTKINKTKLNRFLKILFIWIAIWTPGVSLGYFMMPLWEGGKIAIPWSLENDILRNITFFGFCILVIYEFISFVMMLGTVFIFFQLEYIFEKKPTPFDKVLIKLSDAGFVDQDSKNLIKTELSRRGF